MIYAQLYATVIVTEKQKQLPDNYYNYQGNF